MLLKRKYLQLSKRYYRKIIRHLTIADIILIGVLLCISIFLQFSFLKQAQAKQAEIIYQGEIVGRFDLNREKVIPIAEGITVEIKDGKARLAEDTSPRQIGVKQGWSNQIPIISVPSELIIRFPNEKEKMLITY